MATIIRISGSLRRGSYKTALLRAAAQLIQMARSCRSRRFVRRIAPNRSAWVQLARGAATLNGHEMKEGDGAALDDEDTVQITGLADCEVLLFDLN